MNPLDAAECIEKQAGGDVVARVAEFEATFAGQDTLRTEQLRAHSGINEATLQAALVYDPTTGEIRSSSTDDIACWFIRVPSDYGKLAVMSCASRPSASGHAGSRRPENPGSVRRSPQLTR